MKKLRKISALLLCIVMLIVIVSGCSVKGKPKPLKDETQAEEIVEHETQKDEIGVAQLLKADTPKYAYTVFYPVVSKSQIDKKVKAFAEQVRDDFENTAKKINPKNGKRLELLVDYTVSSLKQKNENKILSVIFRVITDNPYSNIYSDEIRVMNFDFKTQKEITNKDVFKNNFEKELSEIINLKLKNKADVSKMSFESFSFTDSNIIFYFDSNTIMSSNADYTEVSVPYNEIENLLSPQYLKLIFDKENESESQTQVYIDASANPENIASGTKYIAVTFDDGPSEKATKRVLDLLQKYNCKATFFVLGERVKIPACANNLKRAYQIGCEIGNHSYDHSNLRRLSVEQRNKQIRDTNEAIKKVIGTEPTLLRPPYGAYQGFENEVRKPIVLWNIDTEDWKYKDKHNAPRTPDQRERDKNIIISSVLNYVDNGDIILMHDLYDMTADAFEQMLPTLIKRGYRLVTVSELYRIKGETMQAGKVYRGF